MATRAHRQHATERRRFRSRAGVSKSWHKPAPQAVGSDCGPLGWSEARVRCPGRRRQSHPAGSASGCGLPLLTRRWAGHPLPFCRARPGTAQRTAGESGRGLLAVGGPAFADGSVFASLAGTRPPNRTGVQTGTTAAAPSIPSAATAASGSFRSAGSNCPSFHSIQFPALPGSRRGAEDVGSLWRPYRPGTGRTTSAEDQVLSGRSASEQAIKQLAPGTRILHLATHGFFLGGECASALDDTRAVGGLVASGRSKTVAPKKARSAPLPENPLLLSGLAMAGANSAGRSRS